MGEGNYKVYIDKEHLEPVYNVWRTLLGRCCTEKHRDQFPTYADCQVCDEWLCYQNFAQWWNDNMYYVGNEHMYLDKDIKCKGNKLYNPETCIIVPQSINEIFHISGRKNKDRDLPYTIKRTLRGKYSVSYKGNILGQYDTVEECTDIYMRAKRNHIKEKVEEMKDEIPEEIKNILLNW